MKKQLDCDLKRKHDQVDTDSEAEYTANPSPRTDKKTRATYIPLNDSQVCIICNQSSHKGNKQLHRICEENRANKFLKVTKYFKNNYIFTRTCLLKT